MLATIGTLLNWLAAIILYPLIMLPLASLVSANFGKLSRTLIWAAMTILIAWIGILFIHLIPGQTFPLLSNGFGLWSIAVLIFAILVYLSGGITAWIDKAHGIASKICSVTGTSVMWFVLAMAFVQFTVVILRYVFGISFIWMQESITYLHGAVFLLASGYALLTDDHVRVDLFYREASGKRKAIINLLGTYLLLAPVCFLLLWAASPYVYASWEATESSNEASGLQLLFLLKSLIPAFAVLLLLAGFVICNKSISVLRSIPIAEKS